MKVDRRPVRVDRGAPADLGPLLAKAERVNHALSDCLLDRRSVEHVRELTTNEQLALQHTHMIAVHLDALHMILWGIRRDDERAASSQEGGTQ